jgi:hypothetical protein
MTIYHQNRQRPQKRYGRPSKRAARIIRALPDVAAAKARGPAEAPGYKDEILEHREDSFLI